MTQRKQKLELTWIGKEVRPKLEPRILLEDSARSYAAARRFTNRDLFDLMAGIVVLATFRNACSLSSADSLENRAFRAAHVCSAANTTITIGTSTSIRPARLGSRRSSNFAAPMDTGRSG